MDCSWLTWDFTTKICIVKTDKYAEDSLPFKLDNSVFWRRCAKFSNLCQPLGPELTFTVIHYGRQREKVSWIALAGADTEDDDEGLSPRDLSELIYIRSSSEVQLAGLK